jgi:hypothetical protein
MHKHGASRFLLATGVALALAMPAHAGPTAVTVDDWHIDGTCAVFKFDGIDVWYGLPFQTAAGTSAIGTESPVLKALILLDAFNTRRPLLADLKTNPATPCTAVGVVRKIGDVLPWSPQ